MVTNYAPEVLRDIPTQVEPRRCRGLKRVAVVTCLLSVGAAAGLIAGTQIWGRSGSDHPAASNPPAAPSAAQVSAQTVDLCTRFAAGYDALPKTQSNPAAVLPTVSYIGAALNENAVADAGIRAAVANSVRGLQIEAAWLSHEPARGAIRPPVDPQDAQGNAADQRVWDLCRAYKG